MHTIELPDNAWIDRQGNIHDVEKFNHGKKALLICIAKGYLPIYSKSYDKAQDILMNLGWVKVLTWSNRSPMNGCYMSNKCYLSSLQKHLLDRSVYSDVTEINMGFGNYER